MHWLIKFINHIFKQLRIWKMHHLDRRCSITSILQLVYYYSPCTCIVLYDWLQWLLWVLIDSLHCLCPLWLAGVITLGFWLVQCIVCVLYDWLQWSLWVLIRPLYCPCPLWLARVITLGFWLFTALSVSFMIGFSDHFGLVHCIVCVLYDWLEWLLWVFELLFFGPLYCLCPLCLARVITLDFWLVRSIVCFLYDWLEWLLWVFDWFTILSVSFMLG